MIFSLNVSVGLKEIDLSKLEDQGGIFNQLTVTS